MKRDRVTLILRLPRDGVSYKPGGKFKSILTR